MEHVYTKVRQLFRLEDKEEDNLIWAPYKFRTAQKLVLSLSQSEWIHIMQRHIQLRPPFNSKIELYSILRFVKYPIPVR